ncbi:tagatose kinase [Segnochrobactrum spirostomi]|uniref:Sugar kinase n=1 Tax=Segnochrobactrum spirostomi TaxID=2608987 RepID=A0A6A7Y038_9HYPH|nr:sugar kinase [Segnochrobactrum spirostomi]MQT11868.1 sugar kinase [Segnochrobactrum spirostomi]
MKKVITIGEILVEIMADTIGEGFREPIALTGPFPSGAPAIFIDQVAKLGHPCGMVSRVGADDFGRVNLDRLARDGVDVSAIGIDDDLVTGSAFVRYRASGDRDFVFNIKHSASGRIARTAEAEALIAGAGHLHVMGSSLVSEGVVDLIRHAIASIKGRGGSVSFDPNIRKEILGLTGLRAALDDVLAATDLFLPSGPELFLFSDAADEAGAIADLLGRGIAAIVVKRGAAGASYHDKTGSVAVPGFVVDETDPTGAGDSFGAAFLVGWLAGEPPAQALRIANACGARAVTRRGPMEGTSTRADLETFFATARSRA